MGLANVRRQNELKSHPPTLNYVINNRKLLLWCFANFHPKLRSKMGEKYPILTIWPLGCNISLSLSQWRPLPDDVEFNCASLELSFEAVQGCLILVMAEKRTKIRFYSRIFKNIRKNSWYFWCLGWDLSSCGVEIMIVGHSRDLKKFTEFNLPITIGYDQNSVFTTN